MRRPRSCTRAHLALSLRTQRRRRVRAGLLPGSGAARASPAWWQWRSVLLPAPPCHGAAEGAHSQRVLLRQMCARARGLQKATSKRRAERVGTRMQPLERRARARGAAQRRQGGASLARQAGAGMQAGGGFANGVHRWEEIRAGKKYMRERGRRRAGGREREGGKGRE